jgi:hypothetical protein
MIMPKEVQKIFWDTDTKMIKKENRDFVIDRIAEKGGLFAVKWLISKFGKRIIKKTVQGSRNVSIKSKIFWSTI